MVVVGICGGDSYKIKDLREGSGRQFITAAHVGDLKLWKPEDEVEEEDEQHEEELMNQVKKRRKKDWQQKKKRKKEKKRKEQKKQTEKRRWPLVESELISTQIEANLDLGWPNMLQSITYRKSMEEGGRL
ncbi:hypothetical protein O3M35_010676 [Rhynocoris fuscipes]|uniref:Uncharacterized protein n=1 Tax=Rhynocoris fuscipes TaxID=488301 RepID=A0AAW1D0T1_9HEMI